MVVPAGCFRSRICPRPQRRKPVPCTWLCVAQPQTLATEHRKAVALGEGGSARRAGASLSRGTRPPCSVTGWLRSRFATGGLLFQQNSAFRACVITATVMIPLEIAVLTPAEQSRADAHRRAFELAACHVLARKPPGLCARSMSDCRRRSRRLDCPATRTWPEPWIFTSRCEIRRDQSLLRVVRRARGVL